MPIAANPLPPTPYLRECFDYNPETGELRWRERPASHFKDGRHSAEWTCNHVNSEFAGTVAGCWNRHGHKVRIGGIKYRTARIIWKMIHNEDPTEEIDHIDGDPFNNRLSNLRAATHAENCYNRKRKSNNWLGFKGIYTKEGRWGAKIRSGGVTTHLGSFDTPEAAHAAYVEAAHRLHGAFAREG